MTSVSLSAGVFTCLTLFVNTMVVDACVTVSESDVDRHLKRYSTYDTSQGASDGIALSTALLIPEFASNPLYPRILQVFVDAATNRLHANRFLQLCALMSSDMPVTAKKRCTFGPVLGLNVVTYTIQWRRPYS